MTDGDASRRKAQLERFVASYVEPELIQSPENAGSDPQLSTIIVALAERLASSEAGVIIDIGCGHGALLQRLSELPSFAQKNNWLYVGVDSDGNLSELMKLVRKLRFSRRVEPITLEDFYKEWPNFGSPQVAFCRNVLHELTIKETAQLIYHVSAHLQATDYFVIQDLLNFPESERHHVCWPANSLEAILKTVGFQLTTCVPLRSQSGNAWFNLSATQLSSPSRSFDEARKTVLAARQEQWEIWSEFQKLQSASSGARPTIIDALDIDLQLTSLTRQLRDEGAIGLTLDQTSMRRVTLREFTARIDSFVRKGELAQNKPTEYAHFRERGEQLNAMEAFLRSTGALSLVYGGTGTGKSTFISHLLASRLYDKALVALDCRNTRGLWAALEQLFSQIGLRLDADILSVSAGIAPPQIQQPIGQLLNAFAHKIVFVFDNFDSWVDSNGHVSDGELLALLTQLVARPRAKVILVSRTDFVPPSLTRTPGVDTPIRVRLGRFGTDQTVINILDDHFDRGRAGLSDYPQNLIEAIDRHPLIATLVGQILKQRGPSTLLDSQFIREVRNRIREDLYARLVDDRMREAVEVATKLRVPVPSAMLQALASHDSVYYARSAEILYSVHDRRWQELIATLSVLRVRNLSDLTTEAAAEQELEDRDLHRRISSQFYSLYKWSGDDDPKWLRESYFHRMLSGEIAGDGVEAFVGKYYFPELIASAHYCFRKRRDYHACLDLLNSALKLGELDETSMMWRASCMLRTGQRDPGEKEYARLTHEFPTNIGMRTSHVDALLATEQFEAAKVQLDRYKLQPARSDWIAAQWGRVYLGLHDYGSAITAFEGLLKHGAGDPYWYTYLARAYQQFGDLPNAIAVLETARKQFPDNESIATSLGANLERSKSDVAAKALLEPIFERDPGNARAAGALVRIKLRAGDLRGAEAVLVRAKKNARPNQQSFLTSADAEIRLVRDQPHSTITFLEREVEKDSSHVGLLLEAYLKALDSAVDNAERGAFETAAKAVLVPDELKHNMPVQVIRVQLGIALRDRSMFDTAILHLRQTRINPDEIDRLVERWRAVASY